MKHNNEEYSDWDAFEDELWDGLNITLWDTIKTFSILVAVMATFIGSVLLFFL